MDYEKTIEKILKTLNSIIIDDEKLEFSCRKIDNAPYFRVIDIEYQTDRFYFNDGFCCGSDDDENTSFLEYALNNIHDNYFEKENYQISENAIAFRCCDGIVILTLIVDTF